VDLIINITEEIENSKVGDQEKVKIIIIESSREEHKKKLKSAYNQILGLIEINRQREKVCLVHCHHGHSRSGSSAVAFFFFPRANRSRWTKKSISLEEIHHQFVLSSFKPSSSNDQCSLLDIACSKRG